MNRSKDDHIADLVSHAEKLQVRVNNLRRALEWYSDEVMAYSLTQIREPRSAAHEDKGRRARSALELDDIQRGADTYVAPDVHAYKIEAGSIHAPMTVIDAGSIDARTSVVSDTVMLDGRVFKASEQDRFDLHGIEYLAADLDSKPIQADQWDEVLRGKKMSNTTGLTIFKYQMPVLERFTMKLPRQARILRVDDQDGMFWMWAVVDTNQPDEERHFVAVKTGAPFPDRAGLMYIGFCKIFVQQELGLYIFEDSLHGQ